MSLEEHLPGGFLPTTAETVAGPARARSVWPTLSRLACRPMEVLATGEPWHDVARLGRRKSEQPGGKSPPTHPTRPVSTACCPSQRCWNTRRNRGPGPCRSSSVAPPPISARLAWRDRPRNRCGMASSKLVGDMTVMVDLDVALTRNAWRTGEAATTPRIVGSFCLTLKSDGAGLMRVRPPSIRSPFNRQPVGPGTAAVQFDRR